MQGLVRPRQSVLVHLPWLPPCRRRPPCRSKPWLLLRPKSVSDRWDWTLYLALHLLRLLHSDPLKPVSNQQGGFGGRTATAIFINHWIVQLESDLMPPSGSGHLRKREDVLFSLFGMSTALDNLDAPTLLPPPGNTLLVPLGIQTVKQYSPIPPGSILRKKWPGSRCHSSAGPFVCCECCFLEERGCTV